MHTFSYFYQFIKYFRIQHIFETRWQFVSDPLEKKGWKKKSTVEQKENVFSFSYPDLAEGNWVSKFLSGSAGADRL